VNQSGSSFVFDPNSRNYAPATGVGAVADEKVLLWGRPGYLGNKAAGRGAKLYFAINDMPRWHATGDVGWAPKYYAGGSSSAPTFSTNPGAALPVKFRVSADPNNSSTTENDTFDWIGQMSIAWVPPLNKWVMFYGGDAFPMHDRVVNGTRRPHDPYLFNALFGVDPASVPNLAFHANSAISFRTADHPWGPWSVPQDLFPRNTAEALQLYALGVPDQSGVHPGGVFRHPGCAESANALCMHHEQFFADTTQLQPFADFVSLFLDQQTLQTLGPPHVVFNYGYAYGPNIVEPWIMQDPNDANRVIMQWNVSTWNPYQVILVQTRFQK
jgi:hypothetical protein